MKKRLSQDNSGSVVVMAIILTAGILVATVEFSIFAISSIRQARNIDRSIVAYYAAEAGAESALYQLHKQGATSLNPSSGTISVDGTNNATWHLDTPDTFNVDSDVLRTSRLPKHQALQIPLYSNEGDGPLDIHSMKVSWQKATNCDAGTTAWIQGKVSTWTGSGLIQWDNGADPINNVKEYVKTPSATDTSVIFNDVTTDPTTSELFGRSLPMVVGVNSLYCDLYGVTVAFYNKANADGDPTSAIVPISNMYTVAPQGDFQGVRQQLHLTLPRRSGLSSLFDYVLFSEKALQK